MIETNVEIFTASARKEDSVANRLQDTILIAGTAIHSVVSANRDSGVGAKPLTQACLSVYKSGKLRRLRTSKDGLIPTNGKDE